MKHRPRPPEQDDLLRSGLVDTIDLRHERVNLAALIDWEVFGREWVGFFPSTPGRPATPPRLVARRTSGVIASGESGAWQVPAFETADVNSPRDCSPNDRFPDRLAVPGPSAPRHRTSVCW